MGSVLVLEGPRKLTIDVEPDPFMGDEEIRLRTLYSGISAGTELASYRGTNPYLMKRWDAERRLFVPGEGGQLSYPLRGWGYEQVGEIVEVGAGASDLRVGERVYGIWGHRTQHVMKAADARTRLVPAKSDPLLGIFSHMGAIALNGILDAQINLGETVAVFGLGVVGQIVAQLARLSGARVVGVDLLEGRRALAAELGAEEVIDAGQGSAAEALKAFTSGRGADVCIEASGSAVALNEAVRACAYGSRVVAMGFVQGEARGLHLGEEFHHNRIELCCSQISGVRASLMHRWDRPRLVRTFMELAFNGRLALRPLVSHMAPFGDAAALFALIDERPAEALLAVLSFEEAGTTGGDGKGACAEVRP